MALPRKVTPCESASQQVRMMMNHRSASTANDEGFQKSRRTAPAPVAGQNHNHLLDHVVAMQALTLGELTLNPALPRLAPHEAAEQREASMLTVDLSALCRMQVSWCSHSNSTLSECKRS